ncbi:MAG: molybdopterin-dependent oxidoreductase [Beijerinckiaceae bacterium]|nr:molybdopterin-dependent oxidoreductase [Beijerinckiaceae bacterium]
MYPRSMEDSDCVLVMGSNMAENHPVAFRWPMKAKVEHGAKLIHVDPRFTRTSAMADIYAPLRAGSDIAFLGGVVNFVLNSERWNKDPFFRTFATTYTNAASIVSSEFRDTEDMGGVFSGLMAYTGDAPEWPFNGFIGEYESSSWSYEREGGGAGGDNPGGGPRETGREDGGGPNEQPALDATKAGAGGPPYDDLVRALLQPPVQRDDTLTDPRCVLQILRRHFARYTPEMVEQVTGCPRDQFLLVAQTLLDNSGAERTSSIAYAVAWTQHTYGVQIIGCAALLQLLLGNVGRPGAGIVALRGHASIQGSTDVPTLYHSIHGYMSAPSALEPHNSLSEWLAQETQPTGYWANTPKFMVSYLKSMYGAAATRDNDFGYAWHPKIIGDHSHMPMFVAMNEGRVKGMFCIGQNPATSLNAKLERSGLRKLDWLVVKDNWLHETAMFWKTAPEVRAGEVATADIDTEVFFFPSSQVAEYDGSFTNTQRLLQWHYKAADPPGECRSDMYFTYQLGKRLKALYAGSTLPRDQGFLNLVWDYESTDPREQQLGEPESEKILKEINGYYSEEPGRHVAGPEDLADDGSTSCASWIYCGVYPSPDENRSANRQADPPGVPGAHLGWGFAWPSNRRILYNRVSADPQGKPWSERKRYVWWDEAKTQWVGLDVPDFPTTKPPTYRAPPGATGMDAHNGTDAFILKTDGVGWLYVPEGLVDGPLPTHYEPVESVVRNPLYKQQSSPVLKYWKIDGNPLAELADAKYPYVITTYRLTEHYLSGAMSRWLPWLTELQPELFVELSPELANEQGIANLDRVRISSPRATVHAKALVTRRMRPLQVAGRTVHQVGMPFHWGWEGLSTGDAANELTALVGDPNTTMHEGKTFVCNVHKA